MSYQPIENYGIVGDLHSVALVGMDGSIDMMSFPHFDSPTIFAALVDDRKGGRFQIAPTLGNGRHRQLYLPDTNVLLTRFLSQDGVSEVSDFMPVERGATAHDLVRRAKTVRGVVPYRMVCDPRFDYGRADHQAEQKGHEVLFTSRGPDRMALRLRCSVPVRVVNGAAVAEFTLNAGETASFVLEQALEGVESPSSAPDFVPESFKRTVNFWRRWLGSCAYSGRWREMVNRSALTLKMLTSKTYGSIVAAPTFGLPEEIGGERNWDYRYTWIRDASFTLYALIRLGYTNEAAAFMRWIEARCGELNPDGSLQIMYGIDGRHDLTEQELGHLEGYRQSSPVRIGNGAYNQLQLDIYGELMDSVYLYNKYGEPISFDLWRNLVRLIDWVVSNWRKKDEGIWEIRGGRQEFLYSRVMCWVAIDRGIRLAIKRSFPAPLDRWLRVRDEIYLNIFKDFWDPQLQAFVQYKGAKNLDAANLLMPLVKFVGPTDPRWLSTLRAIERELVDDSLVYRYRTKDSASDGLRGKEGTFCMCSFWYVECLSRAGDLEKARFFFEKMLGYANHLGLYAEELGPSGEALGNFPQAFTHLGLISAAVNLDRALSRPRP
ncbi:MAG: glycoside hydrolase family 15 protein [Acidobacteria bacterium]|nr:glycoside hydrolase family 15 protein [Acidobacteriota bacterium]